jgi:hypothetical protein
MSGFDNLSITDSRKRNDGHVECLQKGYGWSAEQAIAAHAYGDQQQEENPGVDKASAKH